MADASVQVKYRPALDGLAGRVAATPSALRRQVRPRSHMPAFGAGHRRDPNPLIGLKVAVDGYLANGSDLHEMLARIDAVLRQLDEGLAAPTLEFAPEPEAHRFRFCGWQLDCGTRVLTDPSGAPVTLTNGEYSLLLVFLNAPRRPLSRAYLLQATHIHEDVSDRSIDVQVLRLRRKLERTLGGQRIVRTTRGVGYVLDAAVERL